MNEFMSETGYWLVPLLVGAALVALAWYGLRQFFWRVVLCTAPLVAGFIVTLNAWYNLQRPEVNVGRVETLSEGPFTRAVEFYSSQPVIDPATIRSAAADWFRNKKESLERQQKTTLADPSSFFEVEGIGQSKGSRYDRVRLKYRVWADRDSPNFLELTSSQGNELINAVTTSLAPTGARFNLGVDLAGGTILVYEVDRDWYENMQKEGRVTFDSANLATVLKRRIDPANLMEITIRPIKSEPPRVEIVLPVRSGKGGVQSQAEIERVKSLVSQVGKLEFRILADAANDNQAMDDAKALTDNPAAVADLNNLPAPEDYAWVELDLDVILERKLNADPRVTGAQRERDGTMIFHVPTAERSAREPAVGRYFILTKVPTPETTVTGEDLTNAHPYVDPQTGRWVTHFSVKGLGSERMYELTRPAVGRWLAVIMDRKVQSYAVIKDPLRDSVQVTMGGGSPTETKRKVDRLVQVLQSGALPATLRHQPVSELTMGPGLGQDTIDRGTTAVIIGFLCVVGFMILYYRFAGFVASTALMANLLLTVGFMVAVKAAFTLPGLAGLVLMVGMAVDSNVLIYERIRDERQRGAALPLAIRNGYNLSLPVILDSHLTSIFTAIVLYAVGNDQLKGFGVSLAVGLVISLFTALTMTRLLFDVFVAKGWLTQLRMGSISWLMKLFGWPRIDFMKWRTYCFSASVALSLLSLVVLVVRGEKGLDIDFTGGTAYHFVFKEPRPLEQVRASLSSRLPDVNVEAIARGGELASRNATEFVVRTTLRDEHGHFNPEEVRRQVAEAFGDQLATVQVAAGPIAKGDGKHLFTVELTANDKAIAPARLRTIVENWLTSKLDVRQPTQFYQISETGQSDGGLYDAVRLQFTVPDDGKSAEDLVHTITTALSGPKSDRLENFDSQLAAQMQQRALLAIALSWLVICLFLWFRFGSWAYGLAAVLCLIHDVLIAIGMIVLAAFVSDTFIGTILLFDDFKIDLPAIAALLTLVGYTVNDKIVVFERIREVQGKSPVLTSQMINETLNQTLSRTLLTGITVLLVLFTLYVVGGEGIRLFSFIMLVGIIVGTYSSIYVASPLLLMFGEGAERERVRGKLQPQQAGV